MLLRHLKRISLLGVCACSVLLLVCSRELGTNPIGGPVDKTSAPFQDDDVATMDSVTEYMSITITPSVLRATAQDTGKVVVRVYDQNRNPLVNQVVRFTARGAGTVTDSAVTNIRGEAYATFQAEAYNTEARVIAWLATKDTIMAVARNVTLEGVDVIVLPEVRHALIGTEVPVNLRVVDGTGNSVQSDITMTGLDTNAATTKGDGTFSTTVSRSSKGAVPISVSARGATSLDTVTFWKTVPKDVSTADRNLALRIYSSRTQVRADNTDYAKITAILVNETNNPAVGETVSFTADLGVIDSVATVDSTGKAVVTLRSAPVNGVCTIEASSQSNLKKQTEVIFSGVSLQLSPEITDQEIEKYVDVEARVTFTHGEVPAYNIAEVPCSKAECPTEGSGHVALQHGHAGATTSAAGIWVEGGTPPATAMRLL